MPRLKTLSPRGEQYSSRTEADPLGDSDAKYRHEYQDHRHPVPEESPQSRLQVSPSTALDIASVLTAVTGCKSATACGTFLALFEATDWGISCVAIGMSAGYSR